MNMKKTLILLIALLFVTGLFADTIYLMGGKEYKCTLIGYKDNTISVKIKGDVKTFDKKDVKKMLLDKRRQYYFTKLINKVKDTDIKGAFNLEGIDNFKNSNYVLLLSKITLTCGKNPTITKKLIYKVLTPDGIRPASNRNFTYMKNYEDYTIDYAISISPKGQVKSIYDNLIEDENPLSRFPMYENIHSVKFAVPSIIKGSIVAFQITKKIQDPSDYPVLLDETFIKEVPAIKQEIIIKNPKNIVYNVLNKGKLKIKKSHKEIVFSYPSTGEIYDTTLLPDYKSFTPRVIISNRCNKNEFSEKFNKFLSKDKTNDENLKKAMSQLNITSNNNDEIVSYIYNFVQSSYVFIPIDINYYSYIPHSLNDILNTKVADILDKTYLAYKMLSYFKIPSKIIYASQKYDFVNKDTFFNIRRYTNALLKTTYKGKDIYLQFTSNLHPFGIISKGLYGMQYFDPMDNTFGNVEPLNARSDDQKTKYELSGNIDEKGTLHGHFIITLGKSYESNYRNLIYVSEQEKYMTMQKLLNSFFKLAEIKNYKIENLKNVFKNIIITFDFTQDNFANVLDNRIMLLNVPIVSFNSYNVGSNNRQLPVFISQEEFYKYIITLKIPQNYKINDAPKPVNICNKNFSVKMIVNAQGNSFRLNMDEYYAGNVAKKGFYFKYKKYIRKLNIFTKSLIVCEKK